MIHQTYLSNGLWIVWYESLSNVADRSFTYAVIDRNGYVHDKGIYRR